MTETAHTHSNAKFNMIEQQIRPWEVLDNRVLDVFNLINREDFVDEKYRGLAYADCQLPVTKGCAMLPPTIEGRLLQALNIQSSDQILEVCSGSGYITACLSHLGREVLCMEKRAEVIEIAENNVRALGCSNVRFKKADALTEIKTQQSFDVIAIHGALDEIPENLKQTLAIGGRLFAVIGQSPVMQAILLKRISHTEWVTESLFETDLPAHS